MSKTITVCTSILLGLLCVSAINHISANTNAFIIEDLFEINNMGADKKGFVEGATYLTLNREVLQHILQQKLRTMTLQIPFGRNKKLDIQLEKADLLSDGFQVMLQEKNFHNTLFYSPALFYRGAVKGEKDALVAINFFQNEVTGVLSLNGNNYNLGRYGKEDPRLFVFYKERALNVSNPFSCSTEDLKTLPLSKNPVATARTDKTVQIYVECDYHLYQANGANAQKTADFATGLFNVISAIYANDNIKMEIADIKVWTSADPYPNNSAKAARDAFGLALNGQFRGDIAHLLSNYTINGTVPNGGSANIDVLCKKNEAVSYTNITTAYSNYPTYSWTAYAVAHEIGHNLGAPHTHSCLWPNGPIDNCWCPEGNCGLGPEPASSGGTLMSYCHLNPKWTDECTLSNSNPGINLAAGLGELPGKLIRERINNAMCLGGIDIAENNFNASALVKNETCFGYQDGAIFININNGQAPFTYQWNNGATSKDLKDIGKGNYSVTITDKNGNISIVQAEVGGTSPIFVDAGEDKTINCLAPIVTLDASKSKSGFQYTYQWSRLGPPLSGKTNEKILPVSEAGTYIFIITNTDNGCKARDTVVVTKNIDKPSADLKAEPLTCQNNVIIIETIADQTIIAYKWTGPQNFSSSVQNPTIGLPGIYQLVLTGENGCTNEKSIEVFENKNPPQIIASASALSCNNLTSQLMVTSSDSNASFKWKGPDNFQSSIPNPIVYRAGIYQVKVTSDNGCFSEANAEVKEDGFELIIRAKGGTLDCDNPSIQFQVHTEEDNISYSWTGPNNFLSEEKSPMASIPGVYQLTAINSSGCTSILDVLVEENFSSPTVSIKGSDLNCSASSVVLKALSNDLVISYLWEHEKKALSSEKVLEIDQPGVYQLTATGSNGCIATAFYEVKENIELPALEIKGKDLSCANSTTRLNAITNSENITFNWAGPNDFQSMEQNPVVAAPGKYTLIIQNENGCTNLASIDIHQLEQPAIIIEPSGQFSCKNESIFLDASKSLLTENSLLEWTTSNGNILSDIHALSIEIDREGTYVLTARDVATACIVHSSIKIEAGTGIVAKVESDKMLNCHQSSIVLTANEANQSPNAIFYWTTEDGQIISDRSKATIIVDAPGLYTLLSTDTTSGCSEAILTRVIQAEVPTAEIATPNPINCHQSSITIDGSASSPTIHSLIEWARNGTKIEASNAFYLNVNTPGIYSMTIMDTLNACQSSKEVEVIEIPTPLVESVDYQQDICGKGEGFIELGVRAWNNNFQIKWNNDSTASRIENLTAGKYTATITDVTGCSVEFNQNILSAPQVSLGNVDIEAISCVDAQNGRIQVDLKGGHPPYNFEWSNGDTAFYAEQLSAGIHSLEITDAQDCVHTFYFELLPPKPLEANLAIEGNKASIFVWGGTPDYRINWSNGDQGATATNLNPGTHQVVIQDANDCSINKAFSIDAVTTTDDIADDLGITIFPNPATDYFKINKVLREKSIIQLSIFAISGQVVFSKIMDHKTIDEIIDTRNWKSGTYFLQVQTEKNLTVKEIQIIIE